MHRLYSLLAIVLLAPCGDQVLFGSSANAGDSGVPMPKATSVSKADPAGGLQPLNTPAGGSTANLGNGPAFPPAMFAVLEDLSKKSIAGGGPASQSAQASAKPAVTGTKTGAADRAVTAPRVQPQSKAPAGQQAGFRGRRSTGPASKIEALRERIQHGPSHLHRRGFRRAA